MSTDKTLADVQPGGRVRLGDQAELDRLEFQAWARELLPCPFCGNGAEFVPYKDNGLTLRCKSMGCIQRNQRTLRYGIDWLRTSMAEHWNTRALSAQPSPGGQGGLNYERMFVDACAALAEVSRELGCDPEQGGAEPILAAIAELREALAARQPVGEPVEHDCANCDRRHAEVICPTCAGIAWDNGRLHEFHEVRELSTSLGEGVLDHLLPDEWHEKPLLRFQGAHDEGDDSVGISPRSANVLADDQTGTVLGDYLAARAAKGGGQ
ncbi:Lar family restriction alleviation protein [Stenotrophomonas maltophilia]|uniref:Lar family restriction alleviation protein n=1 Tax=Stenotrophomonas maltophilia TaxID=40324 RepID=UPI001FA791D5|nr:Lar family restriction alleviation protein [Stenotrophomonas maltophilia]